MYKHVTTEVVELDKDLAKSFAELPHFRGDRARETFQGKRRMEWLYALVMRGDFHTPKWATVLCNGVLYRVNGGHSSKMLADINSAFPEGMKAVIDRFECDSVDDMPDLFDQFDARQSSRTKADRVSAHKAIHEELEKISPTMASRLVHGIDLHLSGCGEERRCDDDERIRLLHAHADFIAWASPLLKLRHTNRVGVAAAAFALYSTTRDPKTLTAFFVMVRDEEHAESNHPTRRLARFLRSAMGHASTVGRTLRAHTSGHKWSSRAFYVKTIHAWNAFRRGTTTMLQYREHAPLPRALH